MDCTYRIILLPGDGVGSEVTDAMRRVLEAASQKYGFFCKFKEHLVGGAACDRTGSPLPQETIDACLNADAVFLGAVGGPMWDELPTDDRPEKGLLRLRKALGVYCNLRPVTVGSAMESLSPLRAERVRGTDLLIVRELTGGLYFGEPRMLSKTAAMNTLRYSREEITRVARIAFEQAQRRRGSVLSVDKANVLEVSVLWRRVVSDLHKSDYEDIELRHMYIDNAAMQMVLNPRQFDVILTSNLFGDILSDLAAVLPGSVGVLPSASVGQGVGLFEPVHGSAPDLAGLGKVNPVAAVLSASMMLDFLGESTGAEGIRRAVDSAMRDGYRTEDMTSGSDHTVGTTEMTDALIARLPPLAPDGIVGMADADHNRI